MGRVSPWPLGERLIYRHLVAGAHPGLLATCVTWRPNVSQVRANRAMLPDVAAQTAASIALFART